MAVVITAVVKNSPAARAGICAGDVLLSINGQEIIDVLDYRFYETDPAVELRLRSPAGEERSIRIRKGQYESLGCEFETYLMDAQHHCKNRCMFCFIDQLPKGLRETLYFKDDDSRLSFLFGNYITLTNLSEHEIERIIRMHISPINISVHTTNPELRVKMMGNRFAGEALQVMERFAAGKIEMNCQLVLCPGVNDGPELERTLRDLLALRVASIAAVPVGVTRYREGLCPIEPYRPEQAAAVLEVIDRWGERFLRETGERTVYAADEFYLAAGRALPPPSYYGEYPQLENGVGLMTSLRAEFEDALQGLEEPPRAPRRVTLATGTAAASFLRSLLDELRGTCHNLKGQVVPVPNDFLGHTITVAGLVTGGDLIRRLKEIPLGDEVLIPAVMLRHEGDLFLDGVSLEQVQKELGVRVRPVKNDGYELLDAILGREPEWQNP